MTAMCFAQNAAARGRQLSLQPVNRTRGQMDCVHHGCFQQYRHTRNSISGTRSKYLRAQLPRSVSAEVQVLELVKGAPGSPVLFFIPGLDGTGSSITPHLQQLADHGLSVQSLFIPPDNRLQWESLTATTVPLIRAAAAAAAPSPLILLAESFGACLALRAVHAAPDAAARLVLVNSATSFNLAMLGLPAIVADTGLLAFFNTPLYDVSQAEPSSSALLRRMFNFTPAQVPSGLRDACGPPPSQGGGATTPKAAPAAAPVTAHRQQQSEWGYTPSQQAACSSFRIQLLRNGALPERVLRRVVVPVVLVCSAQDRLLPSKFEGDRLARILPHARTITLPRSGHAPLLERNFSLLRLLIRARAVPAQPFTAPISDAASVSGADNTLSVEEASVSEQGADLGSISASDLGSSNGSSSSKPAASMQQHGSQRVTTPRDA